MKKMGRGILVKHRSVLRVTWIQKTQVLRRLKIISALAEVGVFFLVLLFFVDNL